MTPSELINNINAIRPNAFSMQDLLGFLTRVEQRVADVQPDLRTADYPYSADGVYVLPENATVREVYRDGVPLLPVTEGSGREGYTVKEGSVLLQGPAFKVLTVCYTLPVPPFALADLDTRTLLLPEQWTDVYVHYLCAQMELFSDNIAQYANHAALFNGRLAEYVRMLYDNRPQGPRQRGRFFNVEA